MPRAFTEQEKTRIQDRLLDAGHSCFARYGLRKTTIEDLVKSAGIAKSSFYLFFDSKESLYAELLMAEMPAMVARLLDGSFGASDNARDALVLLAKGIVREIETNAFARLLLDDPSQLGRLAGAIDFEDVLQRAVELYAPITRRIEEAQAKGEIIPGDPQQIVYCIGLIKLIAFNRDRLPEELHKAMIELAPQVIADGLTCLADKER
jgi:AcrR family transcriptional regulator